MNFDKLNKWLQVSANIGIVLGLVLVGFQLKQNSELTRIQLLYEESNRAVELETQVVGEQAAEVWAKAIRAPEDLTLAEIRIMEALLWSFMEQLRGTYRLAEQGLLSDEDWRIRAESEVTFQLSDPYSRAWWRNFSAGNNSLPQPLREVIDDVIAGDDSSVEDYIMQPQRTLRHEKEALDEFAAAYAEAWSSRDPAKLVSFYSEHGILQINDGEPSVGREAVMQTVESFMSAFPERQPGFGLRYPSYANSFSTDKRTSTMKTRAAVAFEAGKPLEVVEVDLDGPRAGEVLVEVKATGVCHTDAFTLSGDDPEGAFPAILGHEGAGVVVDVGPGVSSVKPGDHVIPLYTPECRECDFCLHPKTNLCQSIRETQGQGLMPDGSSRFSLDGKPILHYMGCSTFSNYTVLPEIAVAKVREDAPFDKICYIGCGVTTGIGAVAFTMKVEAGSTVAVFGLGGIGLNVIQGARMVGATRIIGIDLNAAKRPLAEKFGMTDFVNPAEVDDVVQHLVEMTGGGVDYSFECIGNVNVMRQALECCHKGWGESCIIGVAGAGQEISTRPFQLVTGRSWRGSAFGGARGRTDVPRIVDWYMEGRINIDDMITHTMPLDDINTAFDLMHAGESIRSVVLY